MIGTDKQARCVWNDQSDKADESAKRDRRGGYHRRRDDDDAFHKFNINAKMLRLFFVEQKYVERSRINKHDRKSDGKERKNREDGLPARDAITAEQKCQDAHDVLR